MNYVRLLLHVKAYLMKIVSRIVGLKYLWTRDKGFEETISMLDTPWKISCWLQANVKYVPDKIDYWQNAMETFQRRKGDCDDYARFAQYCLNRHGFSALFLWMWNTKIGHATSIYKDVSGFCTIGTFGLVHHNISSIDKVSGFFLTGNVEWVLLDENLDPANEEDM